jgi:glycosyltransferase involved in cell wall biosynthesis
MGSYEKNIKICFVTREYAHAKMVKTGGIGVFLKQFTAQLKCHDFKITVFSFGDTSVRFDDAGVSVIKIKDLSGFNEWLKAPLRRYKIPGYITIKIILEFLNRLYISLYLSVFVLKHRFDLIEFHDYGGDTPYFLGRLPKIVRCHGTALTLHQCMGYVNRISDSIFEKQFFKRFNRHLIAVSNYSAQTTQDAFHLKIKPKVIYNSVRVPIRDLKSSYLDTPTVPFSVFYFGSIRERKGIDIACEVFNSIANLFPEASFHVMGNNNNNHWGTVATTILTSKALKRTSYYGSIPNEAIYDYLKKAHVVLFPSFGENFSIALLEVMAIGKVPIVSDISSFKEIVVHKHNGFVALTNADYVFYISNIFNNDIQIELISNSAIQTVQDHFDANRIIQENSTYYKSLLSLNPNMEKI